MTEVNGLRLAYRGFVSGLAGAYVWAAIAMALSGLLHGDPVEPLRPIATAISPLAGTPELAFVLGPSGAGKTTLARLIAGLETPDVGEVYFDGRVMNPIPPHDRKVGLVFQDDSLWPHLTVSDNVGYGLRVRGVPLMASDGCGEQSKFDGLRLALAVPTEADARRAFDALADGGSVQMPLTKTFWSPCYGMVTDKYGVGWMVMVPGPAG